MTTAPPSSPIPDASQPNRTPQVVEFDLLHAGKTFTLYQGQHPDGSPRVALVLDDVMSPAFVQVAQVSQAQIDQLLPQELTLQDTLTRRQTVRASWSWRITLRDALTLPSENRWWLHSTTGIAGLAVDFSKMPLSSVQYQMQPGIYHYQTPENIDP